MLEHAAGTVLDDAWLASWLAHGSAMLLNLGVTLNICRAAAPTLHRIAPMVTPGRRRQDTAPPCPSHGQHSLTALPHSLHFAAAAASEGYNFYGGQQHFPAPARWQAHTAVPPRGLAAWQVTSGQHIQGVDYWPASDVGGSASSSQPTTATQLQNQGNQHPRPAGIASHTLLG